MWYDSPLTMVHAIPDQSEQLDAETILILPRGTAWARVSVPEEIRHYVLIPRARSRWARIGMQVEPVSAILAHPLEILPVFLSNWSPSYSLVVRTEDTITLTINNEWIKSQPFEERMPLTADAVSLRIKEGVLPKRIHKRKSVPFFDPREMDIRECTEIIPYDMLTLKKHDFLVVPVCERPLIANGHIGFITSAVNGLRQNSAQYDYAGSYGVRVMEFKVTARRPIRVEPGMHIGNLTIYRATSSLPRYQGALGKCESIMPFSWA